MVSHRLRHLRLAKGFTLDQLAEMSGVNRGTIHRIELDQVSPRLDTLALICKALGTDFQGFFHYRVTEDGFGSHDATLTGAELAPGGPDLGPRDFRHGVLDWLEHLEALIHESADGVAVLDREGRVIYESRASLHLRGPKAISERYSPWFGIAHADDQPVLEAGTRRVVQDSQDIVRLEYRVAQGDGSWRWLRGSLHNQLDHPAIEGIVMNTQDITDWKLAQEQQDRIQKLEAQLQVMRAMTAEFSNLWMGVQGHIDVSLLEGADPGRLAGLQTSLDRARHLLDRMRDACGHPSLDLKAVDLNQMIREQVVRHAGLAQAPQAFQVDLAESVPAIPGDRELLERLIGYLLAHLEETWDPSLGALRLATSTAHLTREEALRRFPSQPLSFETDAVCLEIHDPSGTVRLEAPGEGFAFLPDHLLPFQGLSLSAVFRTVRDHQGAIEEVREPGHGSWIRLFFPVLAAQVDPRPSGEARASSGTILVVDDEDFLLTVTCDLLAELGFETLPASNGLQALELHAQHGPSIQLVLLDLNMPVMNGEETLRRLRAVDSQVKVLLCTGASAAIPFQDLQHLNLSGVLRKPYSYEDLRKVITEALSA